VERTDRVSDRSTTRDEYVHQEVPAIRGRGHLLDEQTADVVVGAEVFEREV
jgi:hypothetical protein